MPLDFKPQAETPTTSGDYILYNQCDGYHIAEAMFERHDGGKFMGFFSFMGHEYEPDTYQAWALLPDTAKLYELFADKPRDGLSANDVALDRIKRQAAGA